MRIGLIVPGGVDRSAQVRVIPVLLALIERLARRHKVFVVAIDQEPEACEYSLLGARVVNLGSLPHHRIINWPIRLRRLLSALRSFGESFDVLHAFWAHPPGSLAIAAGALTGTPVLVSIGGGELAWLPEISYGGQGALRGRTVISGTVRRAAAVSAPSAYTLQSLKKLRKDALWLPLGVAGSFFQGGIADTTGGSKRLLHVASLNWVKDQTTLMHAMRLVSDVYPDVRLDCIGVDTLGGRIQRLACDLGISNAVRFHDVLPVDELLPFYRKAHVYVQSSRHESMGAAVLEASAAGVPVVGTAVGLVAEMSPQAALAVRVGDAESLARGILTLLSDEEQRVRVGRWAQKFARMYNADWTALQLEAIYEKVVGTETPRPADRSLESHLISADR
jgi:glycosyltransferase involved in cell wall biosynthesis